MAYSSLEWRSRLFKQSFDSSKGEIVGAPISILESSYPIRDHAISPDGQWIAYDAFVGGNEDLFLIGSDGNGLRRLTDDPPRDRAPVWTPDGSRIAFYSDRTGTYRIWFIRPDGSGLQELKVADSSYNLPTISPDGLQIAASDTRRPWSITDVKNPKNPSTKFMQDPNPTGKFWPFSWSPDGKFLAGAFFEQGIARDVATFSLDTSKFQMLGQRTVGQFVMLSWLSDSKRLIYRDRRGIFLVDTQTHDSKPLITVGGYLIARSLAISSDDRIITYTETGTSGDIWMLELGTQKSKTR
jgi:Tol biopolymer transport system component